MPLFPFISRPTHRTQGFTLVETLVVISITAVLMTFIMMTVKSLNENSHMAACAANLRQIGLGMKIYTDEHQGFYPDTSHTATDGQSWIYQLEPYLSNFDKTRICPSDPMARQRLQNKASSYILNSLVFIPELDAFGEPIGPNYQNSALLHDPSSTILVFTASDHAALYPGDDHTHSDLWTSWTHVLRDIAPDRHKKRPSQNSTKGCANYLYADGHVQSIPANEIKNKIEQGVNIATIPGIPN